MEKQKTVRYYTVLVILGVFVILAAALIGQNFWKSSTPSEGRIELLDDGAFSKKETGSVKNTGEITEKNPKTECLYLWNSRDENSRLLHEQMPRILGDMKAEYTEIDIAGEALPDLKNFRKAVLGFTDYLPIKSGITRVGDWVADGGQLLVAQVPELETASRWLWERAGVETIGSSFYKTETIRLTGDFMLHGEICDYEIESPFESTLSVVLRDDCTVHMVSGDEIQMPVLWERKVDQGKAVVVNLGIYEKAYRGIYAAAYSLLGEACAYPVINSSAFYLDGFPAPMPQGENAYITDAYGKMDLHTFYIYKWWPDLLELADEYGICYTGAMTESADSHVDPPYEVTGTRNRYQYFGSMLLEKNGEIGIYGYNSQPLCLQGFGDAFSGRMSEKLDYEEDLLFKYWKSETDMADSLKELERFTKELFPKQTLLVYAPPSGILSEEGRRKLLETIPETRIIAGNYFDGSFAEGREFCVAEGGIVETPRITYGCYISGSMLLSALSELNFHYVNSHRMSMTDTMNPDDGAEEGWPSLKERTKDYMEWLYTAAPEIRNLKGSEAGAAVQRFYYLSVQKELSKDGMTLELGNFQDEAWLLVRFNEWEPAVTEGAVTGGKLTKLQGNLYLLEAEAERIFIEKKVVR